MARERDIDWADWKGHVDNPQADAPASSLKKGADAVKEALTTGRLPILQDAPKQPTKEEFEARVAAMLPSEEQIATSEAEWRDAFKKKLSAAFKPIDHLNKSDVAAREWGSGKSFNSMLTEEEKRARAAYVGKDNE